MDCMIKKEGRMDMIIFMFSFIINISYIIFIRGVRIYNGSTGLRMGRRKAIISN